MTWLDRKTVITFLFFFGILLFSSYFFERQGLSSFQFDAVLIRKAGMAAAIAFVLSFFLSRARQALKEN